MFLFLTDLQLVYEVSALFLIYLSSRNVNQFMGLILVNFFTLSPNKTKSISYIFNVNTSNNRCVIPLLLCQLLIL